MPAHVISVPERGHTDLAVPVWDLLKSEPDFWQLVDRGLVRVSTPSQGRIRIHGGSYVGRCDLGAVRIELVEKVPGTLRACLSYATAEAFRVERLPRPASELDALFALLTDHLDRYVSSGRKFRYRRRRERGSLVGGPISMTGTAALWARGLRHQVAFDRELVAFDLPLNRVLLAAVREVDRIATRIDMPPRYVVRARTFALLFQDCLHRDVFMRHRDHFADLATAHSETEQSAALRDLMSLAAVVLSHESFGPVATTGGEAPRSWFINLETLFEVAVRRQLAELLSPGLEVERGSATARPIFEARQERYRAYPDIVVRAHEAVLTVGDVKYKSWSPGGSHKDLYQLLVHTAAFDSRFAFLIFPGASFSAESFGRSVTGCTTWVFSIDPLRLPEDLKKAWQHLGLQDQAPSGSRVT